MRGEAKQSGGNNNRNGWITLGAKEMMMIVAHELPHRNVINKPHPLRHH